MKKRQLLIGIVVISIHGSAQGTWIQKTDCPAVAREYPVSFSIGDKGYAGFGNNDNSYKRDLWQWDQATDTWTQKTSASAARTFPAIGVIDSKVYVSTGMSAGLTTYAQNWVYDTITDAWTDLCSFPGAVRYETTGFALNGKFYVCNGTKTSSSVVYYNDMYEYDPTSDSWTQKADPPVTRKAGISFVINGKVYIGFGYYYYYSASSSKETYYNDLWEYDPENDTWTQKASLPAKGRIGAYSFVIGDCAYVGGGYNGSSDVSDFWQWNSNTDTWTQMANMGPGAVALGTGFSVNNKGYICFGRSNGNPTSLFWEYTPDTIQTRVVNSVKTSNIKITVKNGKAMISGLPQGETLAVYNLQGTAIYNQKATDETVSVTLPAHGLYVVKVGNESVKVVY